MAWMTWFCGGQVDGLGVLDHVLHVVFGDLAVGGDDRMHAAIVEAADVAAGDAEIDAADFHIGHLLGLDDGVAHVLLGQRRVGDFALAHAARARLAEADDVQRAVGDSSSPTTAQTLDVPISSPTMMEEELNMFLLGA